MGNAASEMCFGFDDLSKMQKTSITTKTTTTTPYLKRRWQGMGLTVPSDRTLAKLVAPVTLHHHLRVIAGGSWASSHPARAKAASL